jgi:hypothetical protein
MRRHARRSIAGGLIVITAAVPVAAAAELDAASHDDRRPLVVEVRDRGFDWADAAIGAAATLGVVTAGAGAALVIRRSDDQQARRGAAGRATNQSGR